MGSALPATAGRFSTIPALQLVFEGEIMKNVLFLMVMIGAVLSGVAEKR